MTPQPGGYVFISYSKKQRDYARRLADNLLRQGFNVWIDDRIDYGTNWWNEIVAAIQNCATLIVVMTPEAKESRWVQREVQLAENARKPIFPLLLEGDNWELFVLTQYLDVRDGNLPPPDFVDRLGTLTPRAARRGRLAAPAAVPKTGAGVNWLLRGVIVLLFVALVAGIGWFVLQQILPKLAQTSGPDRVLLEAVSPGPLAYEVMPAVTMDPAAAHDVLKLRLWQVIRLQDGRINFKAVLTFENVADKPFGLAFDQGNFNLQGFGGHRSPVVNGCCPGDLAPGTSREVVLLFEDMAGWVRNVPSEAQLNVEGVYPVQHAAWRLPLPDRLD